MQHTTIAVDLAKSVFQVALSTHPGRVDEERRLSRGRFLAFFATRPPATVLLEACGSAHHWGRELARLGHTVRLLPAKDVHRYVRRNKTDRTDTKALLEAARNDEIHAVPVKTITQQGLTSLHRTRSAWQGTRTDRVNLIRGLLREFGVTRRGWLGVRIQTVNDEMAEARGMDKAMGALVADVTEGSPAAAGGVEAGDVIIKFDGADVVEMRDLPRMVADTAVDKTVRVVVFRKGKTQTLKITIALLEEEGGRVAAKAPDSDNGDPGDELELTELGLMLSTLSANARSRFGIADDVSGVVVTDVANGGSADDKGVRPGDVIVEVGQEPVGSPAEVEARVADAAAAGRESVLFLIQSGGDLRFVPLTIGG